jgi:excisionase family DNA binding protein
MGRNSSRKRSVKNAENCHLCYNNTCNMNLDKRNINLDNLPLALDVNDVAKVLGISKKNAYDLFHSKSFPSVKIGKRLLIPRAAFERWMENPFIFERKDDSNG